jgi:hypothetical protein
LFGVPYAGQKDTIRMNVQLLRSIWKQGYQTHFQQEDHGEICKTHGHDPYHCPMMQKYKTIPKSSYCNFCKSVGHDDKDCRTMELMRERTSDTYRVQEEMMTGQDAPQFNQVPPPYNNATTTIQQCTTTI